MSGNKATQSVAGKDKHAAVWRPRRGEWFLYMNVPLNSVDKALFTVYCLDCGYSTMSTKVKNNVPLLNADDSSKMFYWVNLKTF